MKELNYIDGAWVEGNPPLIGPLSHAAWMASTVFDGARYFEGVAPDLDLHCERMIASAKAMDLAPMVTAKEIEELVWHGLQRFDRDAAVYIRPMFYAETGFVAPDPESTRFVLSLFEAAMPPAAGFSACLSPYRRPTPESAPTDAKAACLYPNAGRALRDAMNRGFDNGVVLDPIGHVAEFATANLFMAKDGEVATPYANGTFLNGITRQRVIRLLAESGVTVAERPVGLPELMAADEIFSTGNFAKVVPLTRIEDRDLQPGPVYTKARELYWRFAHQG